MAEGVVESAIFTDEAVVDVAIFTDEGVVESAIFTDETVADSAIFTNEGVVDSAILVIDVDAGTILWDVADAGILMLRSPTIIVSALPRVTGVYGGAAGASHVIAAAERVG
jgi:hypothetical protein